MYVWFMLHFFTFLLWNAWVYKTHMYNLENDYKTMTPIATCIKKYNIAILKTLI